MGHCAFNQFILDAFSDYQQQSCQVVMSINCFVFGFHVGFNPLFIGIAEIFSMFIEAYLPAPQIFPCLCKAIAAKIGHLSCNFRVAF